MSVARTMRASDGGAREPPPAPPAALEDERLGRYHERTRTHGVDRVLYWTVRAFLQPALQIYFRLRRTGRDHVPKGAVILAANHRSFLDPFIIGTCVFRPVYFVAKKELFDKRWQGWLLNRLGAFPVKRGQSDEESTQTALAVLARGGAVVIFPEGTRHREGPLHEPRRGVGRLALESGAPVVPIALTGTERARRGWRVRPVKVCVRLGRPLRFPRVDRPSKELATEVTARIWPCVELQWAWLGGPLPARRAETPTDDKELSAA
jgi:1-acyl-sn-glycerol-3-phosphate acyltransferase